MIPYAHSKDGKTPAEWETLYGDSGHALRVCRQIAAFADILSPENATVVRPILEALARYHDMGKATEAWQEYLQRSAAGQTAAKVNHKRAAAKWLSEIRGIGPLLAYAAEGHHSGLPDGAALFPIETPAGYEETVAALPPEWATCPQLSFPQLQKGRHDEMLFGLHLITRMLHSSLVDADWLATEQFTAPEQHAERKEMDYLTPEQLSEKLEQALADKEAAARGRMDDIRAVIHRECYKAAEHPKGVYQLNVPTGGGKTLSSLSFALRHAQLHGQKRVIYVIPFTSIIEQTAEEFRKMLGAENVLEHHSNICAEQDTRANRYASENWDAPVIVTTAVQFFESLFSSQNSRCRKLHNMTNSVIIFDEAQTLPTAYLAPCLAVMKALQRYCGCTLLLCTATQPTLTNEHKFNIGWEKHEVRSLLSAENETNIFERMGRRTGIEFIGPRSQCELIEHYATRGVDSALFIVNLTKQAQELVAEFQAHGYEHIYHLSARMCPLHRSDVLREVRQRLRDGQPTLLVATRVIEAGVDISFSIVYRDRCGLDSLAQSAGRCNRHGELPLGKVYAFEASEDNYRIPHSLEDLEDGIYALQETRILCSENSLFSSEAVDTYFRLYYQRRGERIPGWDRHRIMGLIGPGKEMVKAWDFPEIDHHFHLIGDEQSAILVPYGPDADAWAESIRRKARLRLPLTRADYREAQRRSVNVYSNLLQKLAPQLEELYPESGLRLITLPDTYNLVTGLQATSDEPSFIL